MNGDECDEGPRAPGRGLGTGFLIFRAAASTVLALVFLLGAGLTAVGAYFLVDLERHPPEPPGQLAGVAFLALAAVGAVLALVGVGGIALLAWRSRRRAR